MAAECKKPTPRVKPLRSGIASGIAWSYTAVMPGPAIDNLPQTAIPLPMAAIAEFCRRWGVKEFALFGSVLRDDFRPDSDVDVMVTFEESSHPTLFEFAEMQEHLAAILGRKVDLVTRSGVE